MLFDDTDAQVVEQASSEVVSDSTPIGETNAEMRANALDDGEANAVIDELSKVDREVTAADLRRLPGTKELTDEQLLERWKAIQSERGPARGVDGKFISRQQPAQPAVKRSWKLYDDKGAEAAVTPEMEAFLKYKFGYNAMGKEQRKTFDEVLRNAQLGHFNEHKLTQALNERNTVQQKYTTAEQARVKIESEYKRDKRLWEYSLQQLASGNSEPILKMLDQYQQSLHEQAFAEETPETTDASAETAGQQMWFTQVVPQLDQIAQRYGVQAKSVQDAATHFITREGEFLTPEKLTQIIQYEIPHWLESHGFGAGGSRQPNGQGNDELAALKAKNQELAAKLANQETEAARARGRGAPPPGSGSGGSSSTGVPKFKSKDEMRRYLRGENDA